MTINDLFFSSRIPNRRSLGLAAGLLLLGLCLWPSDTQGQASKPDDKAAPVAVDGKLLLIGSLASSHVYTTFGYIGVVADNAQQDLYPLQRVEDLMKEVSVISDSLIALLDGVQTSSLTAEDGKPVE